MGCRACGILAKHRFIIAVALLCFFVLVFKGLLFMNSVYGHHDAQVYIDLTRSLATGQGLLSHAYHTSPALFHGAIAFLMYLPSFGIYTVAIALQAAYFSLSLLLFWLFARRRGLNGICILFYIAGYLVLSLESSWLMLEPPLLFFLSLSLYFERKPWFASVFFAFAVLTKGYAGLLMLPMVLVLYNDWKSMTKFVVLPIAVAVVWSASTAAVPGNFEQMVNTHYWRYSYLGAAGQSSWTSAPSMVSDIALGIASKPSVLFEHLFTVRSLVYLIFFFGTAAFFPLVAFAKRPRWVLVFLPMLLALLISSQEGMSRPFTQYHVAMLPFLAWTAAEALGSLRISKTRLDSITKHGIAICFAVSVAMALIIYQPAEPGIRDCVMRASGSVIAAEDGSRDLFFFTGSNVWWIYHSGRWVNSSYEGHGNWIIQDLNNATYYDIRADYVMRWRPDIIEHFPAAEKDYEQICSAGGYGLLRLVV